MPMSLFTVRLCTKIGAREKGPGDLHRHRTDGSDVPPFCLFGYVRLE